ncbi:MAG: polysaccharide biosynthesis/export family protein [Verrucomicrobiota bacterium]
MKQLKQFIRQLAVVTAVVCLGLVLSGCQTAKFADYPELTSVAPTSNPPTATPDAGTPPNNIPKPPDYRPPQQGTSDTLFIGDVVTITFNSGDSQPLPQHQEAIKDDGRITPPYVGSVMAKGLSTGELQSRLQKLYDRLYRNMTVTVASKDRYYYVSGDVKNPGTKPYLGETDILKAISSAGDFTDFAKRSKVQINRASGKMETIDAEEAIRDPKKNVPVYPGDHIFVPRRLF